MSDLFSLNLLVVVVSGFWLIIVFCAENYYYNHWHNNLGEISQQSDIVQALLVLSKANSKNMSKYNNLDFHLTLKYSTGANKE